MSDEQTGSEPAGSGPASEGSAGNGPLDRLRAADPAAGQAPDLTVLRALVDAARHAPDGHATEDQATEDQAIGDQATGDQRPDDEPHAAGDELAAARRRRGRGDRVRWLPVAAASVVAVTVGFSLGNADWPGGNGSDSTAVGAYDQGAEDSEESLESDSSDGDDSSVPMMGDEDSEMDRSSAGPLWPGSDDSLEGSADAADELTVAVDRGGAEYVDGGLSTQGGSQRVWGFDAAAVDAAEVARRAAEALGVEGDLHEEHGAWWVGSADGSTDGPTVYVGTTGTAELWYVHPYAHRVSHGYAADRARATDELDLDVDDSPSLDGPAGQLRDLIAAVGLDAGQFDFATASPESETTWVWATPSQAQGDTAPAWSAVVVGDLMITASGPAAPLVDLGEYGLISPAEAVERLRDTRFDSYRLVDVGLLSTSQESLPEPEPASPLPSPGSDLRWPVAQVRLVAAELVHEIYHAAEGQALLVPRYQLTDARGGVWSVLALAETGLQLTEQG